VKFGDPPSGRTVEGRRAAALKAAETRRFNQMVKERRDAEALEHGFWSKLINRLFWLFGDRR
jgi:hypothetical protein